MSNPAVPFPRGAGTTPGLEEAGMRIDIPGGKHADAKGASAAPAQPLATPQTAAAAPHPPGWTHHARPPNASSDSYFPASAAPKTPRAHGHSRVPSGSGAMPSGRGAHNMSLSLSSVNAPPHGDADADASGYYGDGPHFSHGPPSPSTLTDIILGLHGTLYGGKRLPDEVRQMVGRYYETDAVFESPLLSAHGRDQIANQFIMAFALPGMDVTSELRDVICSDFEFDGTRAGIIDQTINVTFLPAIFGGASPSSTAHQHPEPHAADQTQYGLHSTMATPHPFANYASGSGFPPAPQTTGGAMSSLFSRFGAGGGASGASAAKSGMHSPTTPYSLWGSSRPHTPGNGGHGLRPLSNASAPQSAHPGWLPRASTPPSVNGEYDEDESYSANGGGDSAGLGDETTMVAARPAMPQEALVPHWSHEGLGRSTVRNLVWSLVHPRQALRSLCTIQLRVMSRLEFNDVGLIVRHEDTWGLREAIEGTIPFIGLLYAIERRVVGFLVSWAVSKGVRLSESITSTGRIGPPRPASEPGTPWALTEKGDHHRSGANEAARALLLGGHHQRAHSAQPQFYTISRSRATSPTRFRFLSSGGSSHGAQTVTGTRSRARSLIGTHGMTSRTTSSDNLALYGSYHGYNHAHEAKDRELPPDSSARYRSRRLDGGRNSSTASAPMGDEVHASPGAQTLEAVFADLKAPDRDGH